MVEYKLYCMDMDGRIRSRHDIYAKDDLDALDRARKLCHEYDVEIWQAARSVARLTTDGTASLVSPSAETV
jgi:alkylhydroperoxidase family enzyme